MLTGICVAQRSSQALQLQGGWQSLFKTETWCWSPTGKVSARGWGVWVQEQPSSSPVGRRPSAVCACVLCRLGCGCCSVAAPSAWCPTSRAVWVSWCLAGLKTSSAAVSLSSLVFEVLNICCPELCPSVWDHGNWEKIDLLEGQRTCGHPHKCPCCFCCTLLLCLRAAFLLPYPLFLFKEFARCLIYLSFLPDM